MRSNEEYKALLAKINVQKGIYAEKEATVNEELEQKIQLAFEKKKKMNNLFVIVSLGMMVLLGIIYEFLKFFNEKESIIFFIIGMVLVVLIILGLGIYHQKVLEKLTRLKEEDVEKKKIRDQIRELNNEISSLVVSVVVLNEHFEELSNIKDQTILEEKWKLYSNQVIMAINKKYNYQANYNDYQEFLRNYENHLNSKEV